MQTLEEIARSLQAAKDRLHELKERDMHSPLISVEVRAIQVLEAALIEAKKKGAPE